MIRRRGQESQEESSSSEEDDAFSALSRKRGAKRSKVEQAIHNPPNSTTPATTSTSDDREKTHITAAPVLPVSLTSSMKRHHKPSDTRKAKMDALLEELAAEQKDRPPERSSRHGRFVPGKKGSYVDPAEEHLTSNMFVGNLAPAVTEEELTNLFLQFGDLYSVKIMWPRTTAERSRNRNTGFVCFMNREDAEEAMETCNETDPFNVGRHLMMRWGKNVKKTGEALKLTPMPKAAAESSMRNTNMQATLIQDPDEIFLEPAAQLSVDGLPLMIRFDSKPQPIDVFNAVAYNPEAHGANSIPVELPPDPNQDTMIRQRADDKVRDDAIRKEQEERRYPIREKEYMTGRQLERARGGRRKGDRKGMSEGRAVMMDRELQEFDLLVRKKLTVSRDAICAAMAFCFENSASAREIADLLKTCLVDEASVDTKIARLYLLSDILFNSQQPGVKNAFMYRDAIEKMAGEVFASLGKTDARDGSIGRMTMNKLRMAMKSVLGAWTEWSVYNPSFLDELEARFDGREIKDESSKKEMEVKETTEEKDEKPAEPVEIIIKTPQGDWTEVNESDKKTNEKPNELQRLEIARSDNNLLSDKGEQAKNTTEENTNLDGQLVSRLQYDGENNEGQEITALVGAPMDKEDLDGKPVAENNADLKDLDGSPIEDPADVQDIDGEAIADDDVDGSPLEDEDVDGESLDGNQLSEAFDVGKEELDGEIVDSQDLDGEAIDEEAMEGEKLDGTAIDGEDLDGEEVDTSDLR